MFDKFLKLYLSYHPSIGSQYGMCEYDKYLEDPTIENLENEIKNLHKFLKDNKSNNKDDDYIQIKAQIYKRQYEIEIWKKPFVDPNYYYNIIYNSIFWITERTDYDINKFKNSSLDLRIRNIDNLIESMNNNITVVPKRYLEIFEGNIRSFEEINIPKDIRLHVIDLLTKSFVKFKKLKSYKYNLGYDNLSKIFNNNECTNINLKELYNEALKEYKDIRKEFIETVNKYEGKNIAEKLHTYEFKKYLTKQDITKYIDTTIDLFKKFVKRSKILDISFISQPLHVQKSDIYNMQINEIITCNHNKKQNYIKLYVTPPNKPYNGVSYINVIVHEYIHYIQYEKDRFKKNMLPIMFYNISTAEGVAHFFEEYVYENNFADQIYKLSFLHDKLYRITRFIIGYQIHVQNLGFREAINKFTNMSLYFNKESILYEVRSLISETYNMEYYLGKKLIKKNIKEFGKGFNINSLISYGSIPIYLIFQNEKQKLNS